MDVLIPKDWDISKHTTGRFHKDLKTGRELPIIGATFHNGLNDIEPDGSFVSCDMTIEAVSIGVTTHKIKRGRYGQLRLGDTTSSKPLVKIKDKEMKGISLQYINGGNGSVVVDGKKARFPEVDGVAIDITPTYKGVKVELIISDPQTAPLEYPFSLKDYGQNYSYEIVDGAIIATGTDGKKITLHAPYAVDASGDTGQVSYVMTGVVNNLQTFKKVVDDETWFRQAAAPLMIDPDITIEDGVDGGVIEDTFMWSSAPVNNFGTSSRGEIQDSVGNTSTTTMKVDLSGYEGTVILARFGVDVYQAVGTLTMDWYGVLLDWNEIAPNGATWNDAKSGVTSWNSGGCRGSGTDREVTADGSKVSAINSDFQMTISNTLAQSWMGVASNGIVFDTASSTGETRWRSSESGIGNKPYFYMEYTEDAGLVILRRRMEDY